MRIRNKLDNTTQLAELELQKSGSGQARFLLFLHHDDGSVTTMGNVAAAIACELAECTPQEKVALLLAGFQLPTAGKSEPSQKRLLQLLRATKRKSRRHSAPGKPEPARSKSYAEQKHLGGYSVHHRSDAAHDGEKYKSAPHPFRSRDNAHKDVEVSHQSHHRGSATKSA
jgi:hypothetical protein